MGIGRIMLLTLLSCIVAFPGMYKIMIGIAKTSKKEAVASIIGFDIGLILAVPLLAFIYNPMTPWW